MKETANNAIGVAAYDAHDREYVQISFLTSPPRTAYLTRKDALLLADRIRRKAESLPEELPSRPKLKAVEDGPHGIKVAGAARL
jgi:hypothetical protein